MIRRQEKNPEKFEETYHQRSIVEPVFLVVQVQVHCRGPSKSIADSKTAVQVRLLQHVVVMK